MLHPHFVRFCLAASLVACATAALSAPSAQAPQPSQAPQPALVKPEKILTPEDAAFLEAVNQGNTASVAQKLKANPALATLPPLFLRKDSGLMSDPPLLRPAFGGDIPMMKLLLKAGAKVDAENDFQITALGQAAFFGGKESAAAALLLAHGANVAHRDNAGRTALYRAVEGDNAGTVALLLAHGADVNTRDRDGNSPLDVALDPSNDGLDRVVIINLLRRHGAKK